MAEAFFNKLAFGKVFENSKLNEILNWSASSLGLSFFPTWSLKGIFSSLNKKG